MSVLEISGVEEKGGIPPGSRVQVVTLPGHRKVFAGEADGSLALNLDAGKYRVGVRWNRPRSRGGISYRYDFFHKVTEEEWIILQGIQPGNASSRLTTNGTKWFCGFGNCKVNTGTPLAMAIHEAEDHLGISRKQLVDPNQDPILKMELAQRKQASKDKTKKFKQDPTKAEFLARARSKGKD